MAKYANTLEELRETRNFAKLATVYRYLAKFRDSIAAAAPKVPDGALDPTLDHLDKTLKDYRDLASEITGYPVQDGDLRINLGDEFGAAATPDTGQYASVDPPKIDLLREMAGIKPFKEDELIAQDLNSQVLSSGAGALYGHSASSGALRVLTRADMQSREAEYTWDAMEFDPSNPLVMEARGCLNRWILGAAAVAIAVGLSFGVWLMVGGDDEDSANEEAVAGAETPAATPSRDDDGEAAGVLSGFSAETLSDVAYFSPAFEGFQVSATYVEDDAVDDPFNSFGAEVVFEDDLTELVAGYGGRLDLAEEIGVALTCGNETDSGMTVVCAEGVSGALPAGDYVVMTGSLERPLADWRADVEYKYSAFVEDRGRALAFPDGDPRFPNNTLIKTNSYFSLGTVGGLDWALTTRWSEGQQFRPWSEAPATDNAEQYVRAAIGGNTFVFVAPSELYSDGLYFNVGTEAHPAGQEYTPGNTRQDVLGTNPLDEKPQIYNWLDPEEYDDDEEGPPSQLRVRLADYAQWVREGNGEQLNAHLDRSAKLRWGEEKCMDFFSRVAPDDSFALEILEVRDPTTWDWRIYGLSVGTLFDAYEFDVNLIQQGTTSQVTGHFAWDEEQEDIRIFSPCVTGEEGAAELAAAQAPPTGAPGGAASPTTGSQASGPTVERIRELLPSYEVARRAGDDSLYDFLHPVVIAHYGEAVCRDFYANQIGPDPAFAFTGIGNVTGPETYTYVSQGETIGTADDVYAFKIDTTVGMQTSMFTWRFALIDDQLKVFQRCVR